MALSGTISGAYRGYTLQTTWSAVQNIAGNYSDITAVHRLICDSTYALYISQRTNTCTIDGVQKTFTSPAINTGGGQTITLGSTTHRVYHNSNGTKSCSVSTIFKIQATIVSTYVDNITASGNITLNQIPRQAQITGANNFNDEQNPYFTFTNAGAFQMSAYLSFAGITINRTGLGNATSGSYTFQLTSAERNQLRNATPNSKTMTVTYGLRTVISGTTYTSTLNRTMTIVNANPSAPTLTYFDTNSGTVGITTNNQRIIQNKSTLRAIVGTSVAQKGASISSYSTTINNVTRTGSGNIDFGTLNIASNMNLICTVTDSRGNRASTTKVVIVDAWSNPSAIIDLYRVNNYETSSRLKVDCRFSSLNSKNFVFCQYCYKKTTDTNYSSWTRVTNNELTTISLDNSFDFNIKVEIGDRLSPHIEYNLILPKGQPILFIDTVKKSVSVNRFPTNNNSFEVAGDIYSNGAKIVESGSNANGKWVKYSDGTMICYNYQEVTDVAINNAYGSLYQTTRNITYPQAFISIPTLTCGQFMWGTSASWGSIASHDTPLTNGRLRVIDISPRATGTTCRISWTAIGRWK